MQLELIQQLIAAEMPEADITVTGDGRHFEATIIAEHFTGMALLARQRYIYTLLGDNIQNGTIHAISLKTYTPSEWAKKK